MWWGKNSDSKDAKATETTAAAPAAAASAATDPQRYDEKDKDASAPFDPKKMPNRQKLPPALQKIVDKQDKEDNFFDELVDG